MAVSRRAQHTDQFRSAFALPLPGFPPTGDLFQLGRAQYLDAAGKIKKSVVRLLT